VNSFQKVIPLLRAWLLSPQKARHSFQLLYEGIRTFGNEILPMKHLRKEWRMVLAALGNIKDDTTNSARISSEEIDQLCSHIITMSSCQS
jgi:hypothetical protein